MSESGLGLSPAPLTNVPAFPYLDPAAGRSEVAPQETGSRQNGDLTVRPFERRDIPELLALMKALAEFEGYIDEFAVAASDLVERGLCTDPQFRAWVAIANKRVVGMAVAYVVPFTWTLTPTVVLKELFVEKRFRAVGVGRRLMEALAGFAAAIGAGAVRWSVLAGNMAGSGFYGRLGGRPDARWEPWIVDGADLRRLAERSGSPRQPLGAP